jgi:hypothetical protein
MRKYTWFASLLVMVVLLLGARRTSAQGLPGVDMNDPDMQEMMDVAMQMFQRMQEAGIDFQQLAQDAQSGSFDAEAFQQMLIDRGVIDDAMMKRMQTTGQRMVSKILKQQLNSTDEEWAILSPKIEKVIQVGTVAQRQGSMQFGMGNVRNVTTVSKAMEALRAELKDSTTTDSKIAIKLKEWREAYGKAMAELKSARDDLRGVLTLRQEVVLMNFGLLD